MLILLSQIKNKAMMFFLPLVLNNILEIIDNAIKKEIKCIKIRKDKILVIYR